MQGFKFGYKIYRIAHKVDTYRFADAFNLNTGSSKWVCGVWEYPKFEYRVYRTSVLLTVIFFFSGFAVPQIGMQLLGLGASGFGSDCKRKCSLNLGSNFLGLSSSSLRFLNHCLGYIL